MTPATTTRKHFGGWWTPFESSGCRRIVPCLPTEQVLQNKQNIKQTNHQYMIITSCILVLFFLPTIFSFLHFFNLSFFNSIIIALYLVYLKLIVDEVESPMPLVPPPAPATSGSTLPGTNLSGSTHHRVTRSGCPPTCMDPLSRLLMGNCYQGLFLLGKLIWLLL